VRSLGLALGFMGYLGVLGVPRGALLALFTYLCIIPTHWLLKNHDSSINLLAPPHELNFHNENVEEVMTVAPGLPALKRRRSGGSSGADLRRSNSEKTASTCVYRPRQGHAWPKSPVTKKMAVTFGHV
jgi:hypothetical protein